MHHFDFWQSDIQHGKQKIKVISKHTQSSKKLRRFRAFFKNFIVAFYFKLPKLKSLVVPYCPDEIPCPVKLVFAEKTVGFFNQQYFTLMA